MRKKSILSECGRYLECLCSLRIFFCLFLKFRLDLLFADMNFRKQYLTKNSTEVEFLISSTQKTKNNERKI